MIQTEVHRLAKLAWAQGPWPSMHACKQVVEADLHGIGVSLEMESVEHHEAWVRVLGTARGPVEVELRVRILDAAKFAPHLNWDDDLDFYPRSHALGARQVVVHRDFLGLERSPGDYVLVCRPGPYEDGVNNFLRWVLPKMLLEKGKLLLHSSAAVGPDGRALVFLGPSEAGKSTLASLAQSQGLMALGDDMNVLTLGDGVHGPKIEGALMGQGAGFRGHLGRAYSVRAFFVLHKASLNQIIDMSVTTGARALLAACCNLFCGKTLAAGDEARVLELALGVGLPIRRLEFNRQLQLGEL